MVEEGAETDNSNLIFHDCPVLAAKFEHAFQRIWQLNQPKPVVTMTTRGDAAAMDEGIILFHDQAATVALGDIKELVLSTLSPSQDRVPSMYRRPSESYVRYEAENTTREIDIYYFRSARYPDGLNADEEFTPYVFTDGVLTAIGWTALRGPK
nr:hypothetical protein [Nitrospirales bacterium]